MILLASLAWATTNASTFTSSAGDWQGGDVADGVLSVTNGSTALTTGALASFAFDARLRLAEGTALGLRVGDAALIATYGNGGGLDLNGTTTALPLAEQTFSAVSTGLDGQGVSLLRFGGSWFLYRVVDAVVYAASSADGRMWLDLGAVSDGTAVDAVADAGRVVLYTDCGDVICRAESSDGLDFGNPVAVADGVIESAALGADGVWRLWYTDADGLELATSSDSVSFTLQGLVSDDERLHALDVVDDYDAVWDAPDGLYLSHDADPAFPDAGADLGPLSFGCDLPTQPSLARDGLSYRLAATCDGAPRIATGVPAPGTWVSLHLAWDGTTLEAVWGDAAPITTPLSSANAFTLEAYGTLEMDEVVVTYEAGQPDDTGGDTGPDSGDTGPDSGDTDSGDSAADSADSGDTAPEILYSGADLTGEPGGCGCTSAGAPSLGLLGLGLVVAGLARRRA